METKLIMENWKKFNENPFQLMLEQYDRKVINETQLYERWERQTIREFNQIQKELLEEGLVDTLKATGQKVGDFLKGISEKVSDFVLTNFTDEEKVKLEKVIQNIIEFMPILIDKKLDLFSSTVNNN